MKLCCYLPFEYDEAKDDSGLGTRRKEWLNSFIWRKKNIIFSWKKNHFMNSLERVNVSQLNWMSVPLAWTVRDTIQSASVSRLGNGHMILPDIPSQATQHGAMPSTESVYISLSCYYTFLTDSHVERAFEKLRFGNRIWWDKLLGNLNKREWPKKEERREGRRGGGEKGRRIDTSREREMSQSCVFSPLTRSLGNRLWASISRDCTL